VLQRTATRLKQDETELLNDELNKQDSSIDGVSEPLSYVLMMVCVYGCPIVSSELVMVSKN